jgi:2-phosphosulfolactate phosphatase
MRRPVGDCQDQNMVWSSQDGAGVRVEWGPVGASVLAPHCACLVVVDVLSFTTSVTVAVERGMQVFPYAWRDESAADFADEVDAVLATGRRTGQPEHPWSLSPAALRQAPAVPRLVLPSPNGSAIAAAASAYGATVIAACLRNATAVGHWLGAQGFGTTDRPVGVIPAGERWPDASLRPALEDALGAAAVVAALARRSSTMDHLSAEALLFQTMHGPHTARLVRECLSGRELVDSGFGDDVEVAVEVDTCAVVPVLTGGAFSAHP